MIEQKEIDWVIENFNRINDKWKTSLVVDSSYSGKHERIKGLSDDDNFAIFLLDRQKPSVIPEYDFDQERIGITSKGKVIWGFDSGCSCPIPWEDNYPQCYNLTEKSWKEFIVENINQFDIGSVEEMKKRLQEIVEDTK